MGDEIITISLGAAIFPQHGKTVEELLQYYVKICNPESEKQALGN